MSDAMSAQTVTITGADDDEIPAYFASLDDGGTRGGVVVIHHMPGYDRATKEITRRFAELGYDAICPNLHWRDAPGAAADDAAAASRAAGGVPDARMLADVAGAAAYLRARPSSNGKVGVIGYCSGGRQTTLAACSLDVDAAVDCYGALVVGTLPEGFPLKVEPFPHLLPGLRCPLLGLFGAEDGNPSPADVALLDQILTDNGLAHEFHSYPDTGHGFFSVDRPSYRVAAVNDGWEKITVFFGEHLGARTES
jgi:carboxymethylenebutenolidase